MKNSKSRALEKLQNRKGLKNRACTKARWLHVIKSMVTASIPAAIMSTADSQLLVASSWVVRDIYKKIVAKGKSIAQKKLVFLSRIAVLSLVIAALIPGFTAKQYVF